MILEKTMSDGWLSNTWLVGDQRGGKAVLIDTGGPMEPILEAVETHKLTVTHVLCTHHHIDHVAHNAEYKEHLGCPVCGGKRESELFAGLDRSLDTELEGDDVIETGGLHIRCLHIPGHTKGQLGFLVNEERVFTGDTLFRRSIGGTRGPGHTTYEDIRHSIMEVLMALPKETTVHPGHTDPSSIGEEWEENPFVRAWRGLDAPLNQTCTAFGQPATLLLEADDYDGGKKCWVRFEDGSLDIAPGSQVKLL